MNKCATKLRELIEITFENVQKITTKAMNLARKKFISDCSLAIMDSRSVQFPEIAMSMVGSAKEDSKLRRIQNFMANYELDYYQIACFILLLLPPKTKLKLCLDRTNWKFGQTNHNVLALCVYYHGVGIPIWYEMLDKAGNSQSDERMFLILEVLQIIDAKNIEVIIADREFIGEQWIQFLLHHKLPFIIRIRANQWITINGQAIQLSTLTKGKRKFSLDNVYIFGAYLSISAKKKNKEWVILVTNIETQKAMPWYRKRWSIEVMFQSFKTRGFYLESSHLTDTTRFRKLFAICSIAFTLCVTTGVIRHKHKPIKVKNHGYKAKSFFRHGLDFFRRHFKQNLDISMIFKELVSFININFLALQKIIM